MLHLYYVCRSSCASPLLSLAWKCVDVSGGWCVMQMVSYKIVKADNGDAWVEVSCACDAS